MTHDVDNTIRIYINEELKPTSAAGNGSFSLASDCYIGKSLQRQPLYWPGLITETRVWNTVRTQEEITAYMYSVSPKSEGLVAYWKFDEGNGKTITDYSGNNTSIHSQLQLEVGQCVFS